MVSLHVASLNDSRLDQKDILASIAVVNFYFKQFLSEIEPAEINDQVGLTSALEWILKAYTRISVLMIGVMKAQSRDFKCLLL